MKADLSRTTFDRAKHYKRVPLQQGRAQTDADANEQQAITLHRIETEAADLVGGCGGPVHEAGFELTPDDGDLLIGAGRYYVHGVLCENEEAVAYGAQPDYPLDAAFLADLDEPPTLLPPDPGTYLAYLDVWERHLTALEAPHIREVALGGPDTATRAKAVWQVKLHPLTGADPDGADLHCLSELPSWDEATAPSTGEMGARAEPSTPSDDPCIVAPGAGYRRLENQLYRVEVHEGGVRNDSVFKWDRDNGTIVARLEDQSPDLTEWRVSSVGRDSVLTFAPGDLIEITDDTRELHGLSGTLVVVDGVEGNVITVDTSAPIPAGGSVDMADFPDNPKVRRWNGVLEGVTNQDFQDLEDGVQVRLRGGNGPDGAPRRYRVGDYWTVPARTNTGDVEWPTENDGWRPAEGIHHHYCRLGLLEFDDPGGWSELSDCRTLFPPVTELTGLYYVGGDGQECMPGEELPLPLRVGVANGTHPVEGALVRFTVTSGSAEIAEASGGAAQDTLEVLSNVDGLAECFWSPEDAPLTAEAALLDAAGDPVHLPVRFGANLSTADAVAYTPAGGCVMPDTVTTVQGALDELCVRPTGGGCEVTVGEGGDFPTLTEALEALLEQGLRDICLCLLPGDHELEDALDVAEEGLHLSIHGCGPGTRLRLGSDPLSFAEFASLRLADLTIRRDGSPGTALEIARCLRVDLARLELLGLVTEGEEPLVRIGGAHRIRLDESVVEAWVEGAPERPRAILEEVGEIFTDDFDRERFGRNASEVGLRLAETSPADRRTLAEEIGRRAQSEDLTESELRAYLTFTEALRDEPADPNRLAGALWFIRAHTVAARRSSALFITDAAADTTIEDCEIVGRIQVYGRESGDDAVAADLDLETLLVRLQQSGTQIEGAGRSLRVRASRLTCLSLGNVGLEQLLEVIENEEGDIRGTFQAIHLSENELLTPDTYVVAGVVNLTGNVFEATARVGWAVDRSGIYVGNQSGDADFRNVSVSPPQTAANTLGISS